MKTWINAINIPARPASVVRILSDSSHGRSQPSEIAASPETPKSIISHIPNDLSFIFLSSRRFAFTLYNGGKGIWLVYIG